jgi:hypothetical protein
MKLTKQEIATVLAALRSWQREVRDRAESDSTTFIQQAKDMMPEHFVESYSPRKNIEPLDEDEIDDLCEKINTD